MAWPALVRDLCHGRRLFDPSFNKGRTGIRPQVRRFKVFGANHYTKGNLGSRLCHYKPFGLTMAWPALVRDLCHGRRPF